MAKKKGVDWDAARGYGLSSLTQGAAMKGVKAALKGAGSYGAAPALGGIMAGGFAHQRIQHEMEQARLAPVKKAIREKQVQVARIRDRKEARKRDFRRRNKNG